MHVHWYLIVTIVLAMMFGAGIGSFLNVCIYRLPLQKSILWPGSHCPKCLHPVRAYDNIPIVSWFVLRGRCRDCGAPFSPRYLFIEAMTALLFALVVWVEAPADRAGLWRYLCHVLLCAGLVAASFIDLDYQIIPDSVTAPLMVIGLAFGTWHPEVYLQPIGQAVPAWTAASRAEWMLYGVGLASAWLLLAAWGVWFWSRRAHTRPGSAEWILIAAWLAFGSFHSTVFAYLVRGQPLPGWLRSVSGFSGLWTGITGLLVGAGMIWFVRLAAAGFLRAKRAALARRACAWRAAHPHDPRLGRRRARRKRVTDPPGSLYVWRLIIGASPPQGRWQDVGPWVAKEGMGFGDVTLLGAIGAFAGWQAVILIFFFAPFFGLAINLFQWLFRGTRLIPYGPYLSLAAVFVLTAWPWLWPVSHPYLSAIPELVRLVMGSGPRSSPW